MRYLIGAFGLVNLAIVLGAAVSGTAWWLLAAAFTAGACLYATWRN